jgi:hypothetical protein
MLSQSQFHISHRLPTPEEEAYALVRLFEVEKTKSKALKNYLGAVVGASLVVILLLGACTFGAVFVAVKATKDTQVTLSGALMNKEGSKMLSTVPKAPVSSSSTPPRILLSV